MDIRSKKSEPFAQSEDQEDELLSILAIKGSVIWRKFSAILFLLTCLTAVPSSLLGHSLESCPSSTGPVAGETALTEFEGGFSPSSTKIESDVFRALISHPHSVDALCAVPSSFSIASSAILTGSSDGLLRAVQIFPTKLVGVVADHGTSPIECIAVDKGGEGMWVGSAGHDEVLRMTDLRVIFGGENKVDRDKEESDAKIEDNLKGEEEIPKDSVTAEWQEDTKETDEVNGENSDHVNSCASGNDPKESKRKRKREKVVLDGKSKRGRNDLNADANFFAEL
jgi:hypothetical protein